MLAYGYEQERMAKEPPEQVQAAVAHKKDQDRRRAKGLAHRRGGGGEESSQLMTAVLREGPCSFALGGSGEERMAGFAQLKINCLTVFENNAATGVMQPVATVALSAGHAVTDLGENSGGLQVDCGEDKKTVSLFFSSVAHKQEWLLALQQVSRPAHASKPAINDAVGDSAVPAPAPAFEVDTDSFTTRRADVPFEKLAGVPNASAEFLNRLLWRFFQEMATIGLFEERLGDRIIVQLKKKVAKAREMGKWPWFLEEIRYVGMIKGGGFITAHQIKVDKIAADGTLLGEVDAEYSGGAGVKLHTRVMLPGVLGRLFGSCPVEIVVRLVRIRAIVFVLMPRDFDEKFSLMFEKMPVLDMVKFDVEVYAGAARIPLVRAVDTINNFAASAVLRLMCHGLVYPSSLRFYLPYPGRKPQAKIQKYLTPSDAEKYIKAKARITASMPPGEGQSDTGEPLSAKQVADNKKIAVRRRVATEFFERVLGREEESAAVLSQLCDADTLEVLGFSDIEPHSYGAQSFLLSLTELRRRLQNMTVSIDSESVTEEGVVVVFSLRGIQMSKIWNKFPANAPFSGPPLATGFRGCASFFFDMFGKIIGVEFFWVL